MIFTSVNFFGDSIINPATGVTTAQGWPSLFALHIPVATKNIIAQSGAQSADQSFQVYPVVPSLAALCAVMLGTNDAQQYGASAVKLDAAIKFMRCIAVWNSAPSRVNARSMTKTGTWTDTPVNSIGSVSSAVGSTLTCSVTGSTVYVSYILQNLTGSEGVFTVTIDGVVVDTIHLNGTSVGNTQNGQSFAPACVRYTGFTNTAHTVVITQAFDTKQTHIEWVAGSSQAVKPLVLFANVIRRTPTGYAASSNSDANIADYNTAIAAMQSELVADGLNVSLVDLSSLDPFTLIQADGIHPNVAGHLFLESKFFRSLGIAVKKCQQVYQGVVAIWDKPLSGDNFAPFNDPINHIQELYFHSSFDYYSTVHSETTAINHALVAAATPVVHTFFAVTVSTYLSDTTTDFLVATHNLGYIPRFLVADENNNELPHGFPIQTNAGGGNRRVVFYATTTEIRLMEIATPGSAALPLIAKTYNVAVFRDAAAVPGVGAIDETPSRVRFGFGRIDSDEPTLRVRLLSEAAYFSLPLGRTVDISNGQARFVGADLTVIETSGRFDGGTSSFQGFFGGSPTIKVVA